MEITGKITTILPKITVGANNTEKQSIVVKETIHDTDNDHKNNSLCIDFFGDNIKKIATFTTGDIIKVSFNTSTREWEGKTFNNITGWKCELIGNDHPIEQTGSAPYGDDLPF